MVRLVVQVFQLQAPGSKSVCRDGVDSAALCDLDGLATREIWDVDGLNRHCRIDLK